MNLTLKLSNPELLPDSYRTRSIEFGQSGGTIGRSDSCDWMLDDPDRFVSSRHVRIFSKRNDFFLEDTSTNGAFLNDKLVGKGNQSPLSTGDVLRIGRFIISVEASDAEGKVVGVKPVEAEEGLLGSVSSAGDDLLRDDGDTDSIDNFLEDGLQPEVIEEDAPLMDPIDSVYQQPGVDDVLPALLQQETGAAIPKDWNVRDGSAEAYVPELIETPDEILSEPALMDEVETVDDIDIFEAEDIEIIPEIVSEPTPEIAAPSSVPQPKPVKRKLPEATSFAEGFLNELALPPESATPEHGVLLGAVMKELLDGTIDLINARSDMRSELRLRGTMVGARENNPLKFSINAQDAVLRLGKGEEMGFKEPTAATEEVMQDLRRHQFAMLAGIDAGIKSVLKELDPKSVTNAKGVLGLPGALNRLSERHAKVTENTVERTGGPFWRAFSDAYKSSSSKSDTRS